MVDDHQKFQNDPKKFIEEKVLDPHIELFSQIPTLTSSDPEKSYYRLQLIYNLGRAIFEERELSKLLETVLNALKRLIELERCFVATKDDRGILKPVVSYNIDLSQATTEWPVSKTLIKRVLNEGLSILSSDALIDKELSKIPTISLYEIRSVMCVPLGQKDSCIGLIYVDNRLKANSFSEADLLFLTALGHFIYLGLRNANEIARANAAQKLSDERYAALQNELFRQHQIVGQSLKLLAVYKRLRQAAEKELPILLLGETGTGKELFAKAAHQLSKRSHKPFIPLNIVELSENLLETELFGYEKGAFTDAKSRKTGLLELANEGTLFLDEVAKIPLRIQSKLVRVLEACEFKRVGGIEPIHIDVRLICATNKNLEVAVQKGEFLEDLYFRLLGVGIQLPPLRERVEDIPLLVAHFLEKSGSKKSFTGSALRCMQNYSWPGNVRQLDRVVQEMDAVCDHTEVQAEDLPSYIRTVVAPVSEDTSAFMQLNELISQVEREHIRRALEKAHGNNEKAIGLLGISRAKFFERKRLYNL